MFFDKCKVSIWLAYLSLLYILASAYYLLVTRFYGTPLKDEVKKYPELMKIKNNSARKRKFTFYFGLIIAAIACYYFRPFHSCMKLSSELPKMPENIVPKMPEMPLNLVPKMPENIPDLSNNIPELYNKLPYYSKRS